MARRTDESASSDEQDRFRYRDFQYDAPRNHQSTKMATGVKLEVRKMIVLRSARGTGQN